MQIGSIGAASAKIDLTAGQNTSAASALGNNKSATSQGLRSKFDSFVGETFYGQMLSSMRKTVGKAAYFDGGRGEEIFRGQLDQVLAQKLAESTAQSFSGPMFDLFALQQK
jgi:peptidoglycan hydrolase FlgJ